MAADPRVVRNLKWIEDAASEGLRVFGSGLWEECRGLCHRDIRPYAFPRIAAQRLHARLLAVIAMPVLSMPPRATVRCARWTPRSIRLFGSGSAIEPIFKSSSGRVNEGSEQGTGRR